MGHPGIVAGDITIHARHFVNAVEGHARGPEETSMEHTHPDGGRIGRVSAGPTVHWCSGWS